MKISQTTLLTGIALMLNLVHAQQKVWTIDECVNYAVENNLRVQQSALQMQITENNVNAAKWDYAPNLNFNSNLGWNFGLNIDPVTNEISQSSRTTTFLGLSSNWVLYDGGRKYNNIALSNLNYLSAMYALEDVKNDIRLNVAAAYLQILLNREILVVAEEQVKITQLQNDRMKRLVEAGSRPQGDQLQLEAQLARDQQNLITAQNAVIISRLQLANLLQLEDPSDFSISDPELEVPEAQLLLRDPAEIYSTAVKKQPGIKSAEMNLKSSEENVQISMSPALPTVSLNAQIATSYSDQVMEAGSFTTVTYPVPYYLENGDVDYIPQNRLVPGNFSHKSIGAQFEDNLNEFVGLNLSIPIFNRFAVKNNYQNARINRDISSLQLEQEKNLLKQTIYQAHADARASYNSFLAAEKSLQANEESFKYAQQRYEVGALNQFEYENSRNNLAAAQSQMLRSKYDYIFKVQVLEFYLTNQVKL